MVNMSYCGNGKSLIIVGTTYFIDSRSLFHLVHVDPTRQRLVKVQIDLRQFKLCKWSSSKIW